MHENSFLGPAATSLGPQGTCVEMCMKIRDEISDKIYSSKANSVFAHLSAPYNPLLFRAQKAIRCLAWATASIHTVPLPPFPPTVSCIDQPRPEYPLLTIQCSSRRHRPVLLLIHPLSQGTS